MRWKPGNCVTVFSLVHHLSIVETHIESSRRLHVRELNSNFQESHLTNDQDNIVLSLLSPLVLGPTRQDVYQLQSLLAMLDPRLRNKIPQTSFCLQRSGLIW